LATSRIGFVTRLQPNSTLPSQIRHRDDAISALRDAGCHVVNCVIANDPHDVPQIADELKKGDIDLLLFFFCTWVSEDTTLAIAQELGNVPLFLWALPYLDPSVPMLSPMTGITATSCNLRNADRRFSYQIGAVSHKKIRNITRAARIAAVVKKLRRARFGIFGAPCPGAMDANVDASLLQQHLGMTTIHFDIEDLLQSWKESPEKDALEMAMQLRERTGHSEVPLETIADQCRLLLGMRSLLRKHHLDGFSVRCWPELRDEHKATICLTMAELAESNVASACEADLAALATSYILTSLTGQPSCTLEITAYLEELNALQMAHCGSASLSLAEGGSATIRGHMKTGNGALMEFGFKAGSVTIAKVLRPIRGSMKMFVGRGTVIPSNPGIRGTVATIQVEPSPAQFLECMLQNAVEHHLVIVYGDCSEDLKQFAKFSEIELVAP
jgi:L-fucose isomerase-like protein